MMHYSKDKHIFFSLTRYIASDRIVNAINLKFINYFCYNIIVGVLLKGGVHV